MQRLRDAFERDDAPLAAALCHKLSGSAANVGALAFAAETRNLEQLCRHGDLAAAHDLHRRLAALHPALLEELREIPLQETA
jgi:HPt (histidine-containing phosphotransfer) domain-containing protein